MNAVANNIIRGPWKNESLPITSVDLNPLESVKKLQATHITQTLLTVCPMLFNDIDLAGFDLDETVKDGTFIMEAVKSLLCKHYGIYHPFQDIADQIFVTNEAGNLEFAKRIELDVKPVEALDAEIEYADDLDAIEE
jgi:hypothetical protein